MFCKMKNIRNDYEIWSGETINSIKFSGVNNTNTVTICLGKFSLVIYGTISPKSISASENTLNMCGAVVEDIAVNIFYSNVTVFVKTNLGMFSICFRFYDDTMKTIDDTEALAYYIEADGVRG